MTGRSGSTSERVFNTALGLSFLGWAVAGALSAGGFSTPRLTIIALQVVVGILLLRRSPCGRSGSAVAVLVSLPSLAAGGVCLSMAPPLGHWPAWIDVVFAAGGTLAIFAFIWLSRSFAVLPALRGIVVGGPYRLLRHPGYVGELIMVAACAAAAGQVAALLLFVGAVAFLVPRILAEEQLLQNAPAYVAYAARVRYRLLPGIW